MQPPGVLSNQTLQEATDRLLREAGLPGDFALQQLPGGGNNRVFRVDVNSQRALLKAYFRHPDDKRDRLRAEFSFCSFAWTNGLRWVAQPLARDRDYQLGLYEFINGRRVLPEEVGEDAVRQAMAFFTDVNRYRSQANAQDLPVASEAFFSLVEHLQCIERRLTILNSMEVSSPIDREAAAFVRDEFGPSWQRVRDWVQKGADKLKLSLEAPIPTSDRCLSPSDFGFHNSLRTDDGRLRFLDFEYAGWDDPAKMVCDFFSQIAMPLSADFLDLVLDAVASWLNEPEQFRGRVSLLMPVYRVKWCCIALNEFVRVSQNRRWFANADNARDEKKIKQLEKARRVLRSVTEEQGIHGLR